MDSRLLHHLRPDEKIHYRVLYHVTAKKNLKKIIKEGIKRGRSNVAISPKEISLLRMPESMKQRLRDKWKHDRFVYLTDKRGAEVIAKHWVTCKKMPVIIKVRIPENWLTLFNGVSYNYEKQNPRALEWASIKAIPLEYIIDVYDFEGC